MVFFSLFYFFYFFPNLIRSSPEALWYLIGSRWRWRLLFKQHKSSLNLSGIKPAVRIELNMMCHNWTIMAAQRSPWHQINTESTANLGWRALRGQMCCKLHADCHFHSRGVCLICGNEFHVPPSLELLMKVGRSAVCLFLIFFFIWIIYTRSLMFFFAINGINHKPHTHTLIFNEYRFIHSLPTDTYNMFNPRRVLLWSFTWKKSPSQESCEDGGNENI